VGLRIKDLIPIGERILQNAGVVDYKIDAEALLGFEIGFDKQKMFMNWTYEVSDERSEAWFDLINRRAAGEPLQYITGEQYFMGHRFIVSPSVLIPRPETELLAEKAIDFLNGPKSVLDLCTGSGVLAISIAKACPRARIAASDVSEEALVVAKKNAAALGVSGRIDFTRGDLFSGFRGGSFGKKFDLIVTNPPYIKTGDFENLSREIRDHEPAMALDGGADGLDFYRRIAADARAYMRPGARVMAEIGADQGDDIAALFYETGFTNIKIIQDYSSLDRILIAS